MKTTGGIKVRGEGAQEHSLNKGTRTRGVWRKKFLFPTSTTPSRTCHLSPKTTKRATQPMLWNTVRQLKAFGYRRATSCLGLWTGRVTMDVVGHAFCLWNYPGTSCQWLSCMSSTRHVWRADECPCARSTTRQAYPPTSHPSGTS